MGFNLEGGWLRSVNGIDVTRRPVRYFDAAWPSGHPIGYLFHYTAGCGSDISDVLDNRGISVHFGLIRASQGRIVLDRRCICWLDHWADPRALAAYRRRG